MSRQPATPEVFDLLNEVPVRVLGRSMWPWLWPDDVVTVRTKTKPQVGEVIVVHRGDEAPLIHRVTARRAQEFQSQGDNALNSDGWFADEACAGVVVSARRGVLPLPLPPAWLARRVAPWHRRLFYGLRRRLRP